MLGMFDLASFNFQVPIFGLLAKPTATATKHRATVNTIVLVFMSLLIGKQIFRMIEAAAILAVPGTFSKLQVLQMRDEGWNDEEDNGLGPRRRGSAWLSCIARRSEGIIPLALHTLGRSNLCERTGAATGDGTVGCFFFAASGGEFSGGVLRWARVERRGDAIDREGDEPFGDYVHSARGCRGGDRARRARQNIYRAGGIAVCRASHAGNGAGAV